MSNTVTIICPTFNEEKYIEQTLESFLAQTYKQANLEILIVDGGSSDDTRKIVNKYRNKYKHIRLLDNPHKITPHAFNIGIQEAKGDYIAILGAHTQYAPNYIEVCLEQLIATNSAGCTGRIIAISAYLNFSAQMCEWVTTSSFGVSGKSFRVMEEGYVHSVNFPVFKKSILQDLGGYNTTLMRNQDNDMNQRIIDAGHKLYCTWKTECFYRPPSSLSKLFSYAYRNGYWNAITWLVNPRSMKLHHFVPFFFCMSILMSLLLGIGECVWFKTCYLFSIAFFIIVLHLVTGIIASIISNYRHFDIRKILLPFVFFIFHFSYGWGSLKGFIQRNEKN
jgi:succinoglycan biosynthesis protein ExoA